MCDKVILEDNGILMFLPNCYKYQNTYNKAVHNYVHRLEFVHDC